MITWTYLHNKSAFVSIHPEWKKKTKQYLTNTKKQEHQSCIWGAKQIVLHQVEKNTKSINHEHKRERNRWNRENKIAEGIYHIPTGREGEQEGESNRDPDRRASANTERALALWQRDLGPVHIWAPGMPWPGSAQPDLVKPWGKHLNTSSPPLQHLHR